MAHRTNLTEHVPEQSMCVISAVVRDENDVALPLAAVITLTATLYDEKTGNIINSRDAQDIRNTNGGTLDANGLVTLTLLSADNVMQTGGHPGGRHKETHIVLFQWTYGAPVKDGKHEVAFPVLNLVWWL